MKILYIGHEASLTGAPLILLNLARWIRNTHPETAMDILLLQKGEYVAKYEEIFDEIFVVDPFVDCGTLTRFVRKTKRKLGISNDGVVFDKVNKGGYDVIYCSTVVSLPWAVKIKEQLQIPLLVHVHELATVIRLMSPDFKKLIATADIVVGASDAVNDDLFNRFGVEKLKIRRVHEFIDIPRELQDYSKPPSDVFTIGASGLADWRKGYDLFILLARQYKKYYPENKVTFQWVGYVPAGTNVIIEEDIQKLGLSEYVKFTGKTPTPLAEFKNFDVFVLMSREDPFPLVCLETGSLGKPIICFEHGGGIPELIVGGGGKKVPYLDTEAMAEAIHYYYDDRNALKKDGEYIRQRVNSFDTAVLAPEIYQMFKDLAKK